MLQCGVTALSAEQDLQHLGPAVERTSICVSLQDIVRYDKDIVRYVCLHTFLWSLLRNGFTDFKFKFPHWAFRKILYEINFDSH